MKALAITHKELEKVTELEINELIQTKTTIKPSCVLFEPKTQKDLAIIAYKAQSIKKVILLIDSFKIKTLEDIEKNINLKKIKDLIKTTFAIKCLKIENKELSSNDISYELSGLIKGKTDYKNPETVLLIYIYKNDCYIGIDQLDIDLSKREYRIYIHQEALKATIAYSLLKIADYKKEDTILDPFCGSGTILIEAALFSTNLSQNYYSKDKFEKLETDLEKLDKTTKPKGKIIGYDKELRHIIAAKKNAKIAGIEKNITFSKIEAKDLDLKIEQEQIDKIITHPPNLSKRNQPFIEKTYNEFFKNAYIILKEKGTITLITKTDLIRDIAEKNNFKIKQQIPINIGLDKYDIICFEK
jgi:tRNA (guanine6-N2)-methyltransferase